MNDTVQTKTKSFNKEIFKRNLTGYLFILPQILVFLIFIVYPVFEGFRMSLFKIVQNEEVYIGFQNYSTLASDPLFTKSVVNTVIFVICIVALTIAFALFVSTAIFDKSSRYVSFIRGAYYIPVMVSMVVMSMIWNFLLNPASGLISYYAMQAGGKSINFLGNPKTVLPVIIFVTFVGNVGQAIILYVAAMIGVSKDVFEAAEIDGATRIKIIFSILIPLVKPTTLYITVINIIACLKIFVVIQLLTGGGPNNASITMMFYLYNSAFKYNQIGIASAIGVIMFVIAMALSIPQLMLMLKKEK